MEKARPASLASSDTVRVTNPGGSSPFVLTCDHASNFLPAEFGTLGLACRGPVPSHRLGSRRAAGGNAHGAGARCDAGRNPHFASRHRLQPAARCTGPGAAGQRNDNHTGQYRPVGTSSAPHGSLCHGSRFTVPSSKSSRSRLARGQETRLVSVHSFTPVYKGKNRPWHIGIIHDEDRRLASPLISALKRLAGVTVGVNEPYSPADRVYFTLERHARSRGLPCAMIEIRNDEISGETGQRKWADLLTGIFSNLEPEEAKGSRRSAIGKSVQSAS